MLNQNKIPGVDLEMSFGERRDSFLHGVSNLKYVYPKNKPLLYPGGKANGAIHLIKLFPDDVELLVSPFLGGAGLELVCAERLGTPVKGYDAFDLLACVWESILDLGLRDITCDFMLQKEYSKEGWIFMRDYVTEHNEDETPEGRAKVAGAMIWMNRVSWGGLFLHKPGMIHPYSSGLARRMCERGGVVKYTQKIRELDLSLVDFEKMDFRDSIIKHPNDFIYADPPYAVNVCASDMMKTLYANHDEFEDENGHEILAELLKAHRGKFMLSYNNVDYIRKLYKGFNIHEVKWVNSMKKGSPKKVELVITNY